jgi:hypothetical protein
MQKRPRLAPVRAGSADMPPLSVGHYRGLDNVGQEIVAVSDRRQIPVGNGAQQPLRLALSRAQYYEATLAVQGIAA